MHRLVVNPGTPQAWEIRLREGTNLIGRALHNDFQIEDLSVSGSHCQIHVSDDSVVIVDLGSTNGTFLGRTRIGAAKLSHGQVIRLGGVQVAFYSDEPIALPASEMRPPPLTVMAEGPPPLAPPVTTPAISAGDAAHSVCKYHPTSPARFLCKKCNRTFCELCVTTRKVGGTVTKNCRTCGAECVPVQAELLNTKSKGFFARIPGAFLYPLRGAGVIVVVVGILLFAGLKLAGIMIALGNIRTVGFGLVLGVAAGGYLFTFLQSILYSTTAEDRELPDLPGMSDIAEDILQPFFRFLGLMLFCFGPAIGLRLWLMAGGQAALLPFFLGALLLGWLYFPMAFLAVAVMDSVVAVNPLVVIPAILKAPLQYLFTLILFALFSAVRVGGDVAIRMLCPEGWLTRSTGELVTLVGGNLFLSFAGLYLLIVAVHVLGLIYVTKKDRLGWLR